MRLSELIKQCADNLQDVVNEEWTPEDDLSTTYSAIAVTNDAVVDLYYAYCKPLKQWQCEATICHNATGYTRESRNVEEYLEAALADCVDWNAAEEYYKDHYMTEWEYNGFRNEADFWRWKEG